MVVKLDVPTSLCPECSGLLVEIAKIGETVCEQCGLVIKEREIDISHGGVRAFNYQERDKKWQNGSPVSILLPDISLCTIMERNKISNPNLRRAAKWDVHMSWKSQNLLIAITELKRLSANLELPEHIQKTVIKLYKKALKKDLMRGRSIKGILTACLYLACKKENRPITLQELLGESSVNSREFNKNFSVLIKELKVKSPNLNPVLLIPKYISRLNLDIDIEKQVIELMSSFLKEKFFSGKDPKGLCAGALYLISKLGNRKLSQKAISEVTGTTEVTLRSRYKELINFLDINPILLKHQIINEILLEK